MKKVIVLGVFLNLLFCDMIAQQLYKEDPPVLIKNEGEFGFILHTQGWGFNYRRGKSITVNTKRFWDFDFVTEFHPKEVTTTNPAIPDAKSYIYGKLNNAFFLRAGYGREKIMYDREEKRGLQIRYNYGGGLSMGITKPIYIEVVSQDNIGSNIEKFDPANPQDPNYIIGRASFTYGLDELQFHPGLYYKMGLSFQQCNENNNFYVLETGFVFDVFPKEIPIMMQTPNNKFFLSFYINLMIGKRWNRE